MKNKVLLASAGLGALVLALSAQQSDIIIKLTGGQKPVIAIPELRGAGEAQQFMNTFNQTLFQDVDAAGVFKMAPKSMYPVEVPQRPQDFKPPAAAPGQPPRPGQPPAVVRQGPWLTDWSGSPVNANYLAFGYTAVQDGQMVLFGWLYNVGQPDIANAQVIGKLYYGTLNEAGARKVAQEFAADILSQFGLKSLAGTKIYYVSDRTGNKEIWSMDYDGANQQQFTNYRSITTMPAISPDNSKIAFTTYVRGTPTIEIYSTETSRRLPYYKQQASKNATPDFLVDGKRILYSSTASGYAQIYSATLDGSDLRRISNSRSIEMEPKVNPKTGGEIVFVSGRSGYPQIYKMNMEGADVIRLTTGEGEAVNPSWNPDGQHIVFAWTKGFEFGNFNIFIMDVATRDVVQLTHGTGRNENPVWAPDGKHIVFSSNRSGRASQIWTMLADGTQLKQLTTQGRNEKPVWSRLGN
jgi:TolB protein